MEKQKQDERRDSGLPGGGAGRKDEVGGSGVYPASGPYPPGDAELRGQASWGQGEPRHVWIPVEDARLEGELSAPRELHGIVVFAHGGGSSRRSPRNQYIARVLQQAGMATLLFDLLTEEEEAVDKKTAELRFNIALLAKRLRQATEWVKASPEIRDIDVGYFGASTGAAAALVAASEMEEIRAVVSRGGRPDLAGSALPRVHSPTLLIVGGADPQVLELNRRSLSLLAGEKRLEVVHGATHLFEEAGTLEEAARLARQWFEQHLGRGVAQAEAA